MKETSTIWKQFLNWYSLYSFADSKAGDYSGSSSKICDDDTTIIKDFRRHMKFPIDCYAWLRCVLRVSEIAGVEMDSSFTLFTCTFHSSYWFEFACFGQVCQLCWTRSLNMIISTYQVEKIGPKAWDWTFQAQNERLGRFKRALLKKRPIIFFQTKLHDLSFLETLWLTKISSEATFVVLINESAYLFPSWISSLPFANVIFGTTWNKNPELRDSEFSVTNPVHVTEKFVTAQTACLLWQNSLFLHSTASVICPVVYRDPGCWNQGSMYFLTQSQELWHLIA